MPRSRPGWGRHCDWSDMARVTFSNGTRVTVNGGIADLVKMLGDETIKRGYNIRSGVTGGYNCRKISGTSSYSNHAWGLAVDINWDKNPWRNPLTTDMPGWMVAMWKDYGFRWGGDYRNTKDAMHFEFQGTPADAARQTRRAELNRLGSRSHSSTPRPSTPPASSSGGGKDRTLKWKLPNMKGDDVKWVQRVLRGEGLSIDVDGIFGKQTQGAVKAMQGWNGLERDGIVGPKTWAVLRKY